MRYPAHVYAHTVRDVMSQGISLDDVLQGLARMLVKNGDATHSERIGLAIEEELTKSHGGKWVTLEVARETNVSERLKKMFPISDRVTLHVNPGLIAGVRITINNEEEIDMSFERKVKQLFVM